MGHEVQTATDGLEAVQAAADFHPQIVLLSVDLPRMDGYQTMKRIRSETSKERTLFIAMTTRSQERQRQEALGYGFDRCLITPVKPAAFEQLVELLSD
jgi:CheY-like chemotaxis protein